MPRLICSIQNSQKDLTWLYRLLIRLQQIIQKLSQTEFGDKMYKLLFDFIPTKGIL